MAPWGGVIANKEITIDRYYKLNNNSIDNLSYSSKYQDPLSTLDSIIKPNSIDVDLYHEEQHQNDLSEGLSLNLTYDKTALPELPIKAQHASAIISEVFPNNQTYFPDQGSFSQPHLPHLTLQTPHSNVKPQTVSHKSRRKTASTIQAAPLPNTKQKSAKNEASLYLHNRLEDWAQEINALCLSEIERITHALQSSDAQHPDALHPDTQHKDTLHTDTAYHQAKQLFQQFKQKLLSLLPKPIDEAAIYEMLGQHLVIAPVLQTLFPASDFSKTSELAQTLNEYATCLNQQAAPALLNFIDHLKQTLPFLNESNAAATASLMDTSTMASCSLVAPSATGSYEASAAYDASAVLEVSAKRQLLIIELFNRFFKIALPHMQKKLGIVYTPIEIVDFINLSADKVLEHHFGRKMQDRGVEIIDPFTGTGTFITRLLLNHDLISQDKLLSKVSTEIKAFEIVPLAYFVAALNIETTIKERLAASRNHKVSSDQGGSDPTLQGTNQVVHLCDTFLISNSKGKANDSESLDEAITVIVGNPPYSSGKKDAHDVSALEKYEEVDARISESYAAYANNTTLKRKLYDSYIRAFRWASDRIGSRGVVSFVTNASWIESAGGKGIRHALCEEFNDIYIYHLKGNQRTAGEESRREGGKVFASGSRAPIAITVLVKNPSLSYRGRIHFASVPDYMSREQKLQTIAKEKHILNLTFTEIHPNTHDDWLNQRTFDSSKFICLGDKKQNSGVFKTFSLGVSSNRDAWVYNSSPLKIKRYMESSIDAFNEAAQQNSNGSNCERYQKDTEDRLSHAADATACNKTKHSVTPIKWTRETKKAVTRGVLMTPFDEKLVVKSLYRPFFPQYLYGDRKWLSAPGSTLEHASFNNLFLTISGNGAKSMSCLMTNVPPDLNLQPAGAQCFPRYILDKSGNQVSGIHTHAIEHFNKAYPEMKLNADDIFFYIYGLLHSKDYRERFDGNLIKELPQIPRVADIDDFWSFRSAGQMLSELHTQYEEVKPYSKALILKFLPQGVLANDDATTAHACLSHPADAKRPLGKNVKVLSLEELPHEDPQSFCLQSLRYGKAQKYLHPEFTARASTDKKSMIVYNELYAITNIPSKAHNYLIGSRSALDWVVERYATTINRATGHVNDINDLIAQRGKPYYVLELLLRIITVSIKTVDIIDKLPKLTIHLLDS